MRRLTHILVLALALVLSAGVNGLAAQRVQVRAPLVMGSGVQDPGTPVEMFESSNLDRFLRRAQDFLGRQDYSNAIKVLQNIVEGRTATIADEPGQKDTPKEEPKKDPKKQPRSPNKANKNQGPGNWPIDQDNPAYSVFSTDDRLYRPVSRLCHELLASLPPQGLSLYRARFGFVAEKAYEDALARRDLPAMESVYNKYFITKHAGLAMQAAADLLMDRGRFRSAIQTLHTLLEVYPESCRRESGVQDVLLWVKMAICYEQLGESKSAADVLEQAAAQWPEASVRLMGELHPVAGLVESELFGTRNVAADRPRAVPTTRLDLGASDLSLVPMWEFRFTDMQPYQKVKNTRGNSSYITRTGGVPTGYPREDFGEPGTTVHFLQDQLALKDHYRLVILDLRSGRLQMHTSTIAEVLRAREGSDVKQRKPRLNMPRARLPLYDFFGQRVVDDAKRFYVLEGSRSSPSNSMKVLTDTKLIAYDRETGSEVWSSDKISGTNKAGRATSNVYKDITFLTVPTVFRKNLLVPFMDRGAYGLMCLESATAKEIYRVYIHSAGTPLARAPAVPVKLNAGIAYMLTNAGVLSAVDAHTGVLLWSRKYERAHPLREQPRRNHRLNRNMGFGFGRYQQAKAVSLKGSFQPTELQIIEDRVIFAPNDGKVLLCLDGASGQPLWMLSKEPKHIPRSILQKMSYILGRDDDHLYVMCEGGQVLCVDFRSGTRLWASSFPGAGSVSSNWYGRGTVVGNYILVPGRPETRRLHVLSTRGEHSWRTIELPAFGISKEALKGPFNLQVEGAYLAVCYEGGIELFSSQAALAALADERPDPKDKAAYLVQAGRCEEALQQLQIAITDRSRPAAERKRLARRALSLAAELATRAATNKNRAAALAFLDDCKAWLGDDQHRRWHLARLDVFRILQDIEGIEKEQDIIEVGGGK